MYQRLKQRVDPVHSTECNVKGVEAPNVYELSRTPYYHHQGTIPTLHLASTGKGRRSLILPWAYRHVNARLWLCVDVVSCEYVMLDFCMLDSLFTSMPICSKRTTTTAKGRSSGTTRVFVLLTKLSSCSMPYMYI